MCDFVLLREQMASGPFVLPPMARDGDRLSEPTLLWRLARRVTPTAWR